MTAPVTGDVAAAARAIAAGEVIAIPTDTVYGLACDPANPAAVARIYALKQRPAGLELTLLAASAVQLEPLVSFTPEARALARRFWPGGLSIVLPRVLGSRLAVPRTGGTLAVRVPDHPVCQALAAITGPLATTSANLHGRPAARSAREATTALDNPLSLVLEGGVAAGIASTIIDCTTSPPRVLRDGPIPADSLFAYLEAQQ